MLSSANRDYLVYIHQGETQSSLFDLRYSRVVFLNNATLSEQLGGDIAARRYLKGSEIDTLHHLSLPLREIDINQIKSPLVICLLVIDSCTLSCDYCYGENLNENSIDYATIVKRINEDEDFLSLIIAGGEPLLWPRLMVFLRSINTQKRAVFIDTNGTELTRSEVMTDGDLNYLAENNFNFRVSLDSDKEDINDKLRGKSRKVINGIKRLTDQNVSVWINTVVIKNNIRHLGSLAEFMIGEGISHWTLFRLIGKQRNDAYGCSHDDINEAAATLKTKYGAWINIYYNPSIKPPYSIFMINAQGYYSIPDGSGTNNKMINTISQYSIKDCWAEFNKVDHLKRYIIQDEA